MSLKGSTILYLHLLGVGSIVLFTEILEIRNNRFEYFSTNFEIKFFFSEEIFFLLQVICINKFSTMFQYMILYAQYFFSLKNIFSSTWEVRSNMYQNIFNDVSTYDFECTSFHPIFLAKICNELNKNIYTSFRSSFESPYWLLVTILLCFTLHRHHFLDHPEQF